MTCMQYVCVANILPRVLVHYSFYHYHAAGNIAGEGFGNFVGGLGFANIPQQTLYSALCFIVEPLYKGYSEQGTPL